MSTLIGADMWFPPNQSVIDALKVLQDFAFLAGYVGGPDLYKQTPWPKSNWDLVKANGLKALPVYVPKQDCSQNPIDAANEAMSNCLTVGLTGLVAIDSEASMANVSNHPEWLDSCYREILSNHWNPVNYAGAHYESILAFHWAVDWGMIEEIPLSGEAIQTGPYTLRDIHGNALQEVDADIADSNFPFAEWVEPPSPPQPKPLEDNEMFLIVLTDNGAVGNKDTSWIVTCNGLMSAVDADVTQKLGQAIPVSNGQAQQWSAKTPKH